ncbi:hypothetical protein AB0H83_41865 [Dactylosporangium sp. NPDC050688]|uniref:hypothetical protein n=1 Tax=Dactylosporangium sp. NPDC050688 TaxID=3157217 RepID=UPI0033C93D4C
MSVDDPGELTPMRAIVLPGMAGTAEPDPATGGARPAAVIAPGAGDSGGVSGEAGPPPDVPGRPADRRRRGLRAAAAAAGAGLLIGPLIYSFATGPGGGRSSPAPSLAMAQPGPEESGATRPAGGPSGTVAGSAAAPASNGARTPASPAGAAAQPNGTTGPASPASAVVLTSGAGCANDLRQNWYTSGMDGTWSEKAGGAGGCGASVSMPMSGSPSTDTGPYVVWWFETSPVLTGSCAVAVYIPSSADPKDVAGRPAHYKVLGGRTSSTVHAEFSIDQTANRGRWVSAGTFAVRNGAISIHLGNRGLNPNGERLGAAQVRVSCRPS